jgi:hypothetical protein
MLYFILYKESIRDKNYLKCWTWKPLDAEKLWLRYFCGYNFQIYKSCEEGGHLRLKLVKNCVMIVDIRQLVLCTDSWRSLSWMFLCTDSWRSLSWMFPQTTAVFETSFHCWLVCSRIGEFFTLLQDNEEYSSVGNWKHCLCQPSVKGNKAERGVNRLHIHTASGTVSEKPGSHIFNGDNYTLEEYYSWK